MRKPGSPRGDVGSEGSRKQELWGPTSLPFQKLQDGEGFMGKVAAKEGLEHPPSFGETLGTPNATSRRGDWGDSSLGFQPPSMNHSSHPTIGL